MSYNVTVNQNTAAEQANKQFTGGLHGNVTLESVVFETPRKDGTGDKVLMFNFKGQGGETFRHLEWPVDESRAQDPAKAYENQGKRIKHILSKFIPEESIVIEGVNSYEEFANKVISLLGAANVGLPVAIKLVYNQKGNLEFTKYLGFIAHKVDELRIGNNEIVVKPTAKPSSPDEMELPTATQDNLDF